MARSKQDRAAKEDLPSGTNGRPDNGTRPETPDEAEYERFKDLTRKLLKVPKSELDEKLKGKKPTKS